MKVKELIKELSTMNPEADVIIDVFENAWYELEFASDADCMEEHPEIVLYCEEEIGMTWADFKRGCDDE